MAAPLILTVALNTRVVPYTGQERLVYALLEIGGGEPARALPLDLALVIDCSESMRIKLVTAEQFAALVSSSPASEMLNDNVPAWRIEEVSPEVAERLPSRLGFVQQALGAAAELLAGEDRFSLTGFAGDAQALLPTLPGSQRARLARAAEGLAAFRPGEGTQLSAGLALGCRSLGEMEAPGRARRLLLLTDGFAEDVQACYDWAARARAAGIAISTFGLGSDFNEDLLIPLADQTGGNAYFIEDLGQLPAAFRGELAAARRGVYQNVEIKLRLPRSVSLRRCYRVQPTLGLLEPGFEEDQASCALFLGPAGGQESQALLLEFVVPAWAPGRYRLAQLVLAWDDPNPAQGRPKLRMDVLVEVAEGAQPVLDPRVMTLVERANAFYTGTRALAAARSGSGQAARQLREAATRLLAVGEQRLAETMLAQAEALQTAKPFDPNATKRLSYATRRLNEASGEG